MPRYYLHIRDGDDLWEDEEGQEISTLATARELAILSAREIMSGRIMSGRDPDHSKIEITDTTGQTVLVLPFEEAYTRR